MLFSFYLGNFLYLKQSFGDERNLEGILCSIGSTTSEPLHFTSILNEISFLYFCLLCFDLLSFCCVIQKYTTPPGLPPCSSGDVLFICFNRLRCLFLDFKQKQKLENKISTCYYHTAQILENIILHIHILQAS